MDLFYAIKEPISQLSGKILRNGLKIIPSDHKTIFLTLFFSIFSTVTGVGIVVPLLPIYAHDLGAAGIYVAMIFGSFSISRTFFLPFFGRLSDQKGRKPFILAGLFAYVLVSIAFLFSSTVEELILIRFVQGAGSAMVMPVVQAYVGEITPEGSEGYSMGLFNLSMFLSLSLGPLMGGVIRDVWSMDAAFACMGLLSGAGLAFCFIFLPPLSEENLSLRRQDPLPWPVLARDRALGALFVFRYAYTACIGIIWCFLPLFADKAFHLSGSQIGLLVMLGVFVSGVLQLPMGYVADRSHKNFMIISGGVLSALGMLLVFFSNSFVDLLGAVSLFGAGGGISMPAITALAVIKGDEVKAMGSVMSVMTMAHSLGMFTGSILAGLAMDFFRLELAFPCGTLCMALGTLCFLILIRKP
ncbi:MFS transporter [Desulfospira joergensenii]|uniref:MFS transporter n=1 Tax=Desulfospira joergensenii TaxID=53329 RepID=UPI0003B5A517|nr:MFS transporter [Desulfospira joergensenii]